MENQKLKIGQQFEVVEVLTDGMYLDKTFFKFGGWAVGYREEFSNLVKCVPNGKNVNQFPNLLNMFIDVEVKPVGRLTVTAIHDCESKIK